MNMKKVISLVQKYEETLYIFIEARLNNIKQKEWN